MAVFLDLDRERAPTLHADRESEAICGVDEDRLRPASPVDCGIAPRARLLVELAVLDEQERPHHDRRDLLIPDETVGSIRSLEEVAPVGAFDGQPGHGRFSIGRRNSESGGGNERRGEASLLRDPEPVRFESSRELGDAGVAATDVRRATGRKDHAIRRTGLDVIGQPFRPLREEAGFQDSGVGLPVQRQEEERQPRQGPGPLGNPMELPSDRERPLKSRSKPRYARQCPRDGLELTNHFLPYTQVHRKVRPGEDNYLLLET